MVIFLCKRCRWKNNWDMVSNYDIRSRWFSIRCSQYICYPAAIFGGANITPMQFFNNMCVIFLGNFLGGAILVAGLYTIAYKKND
mgnify:CR=1 FL=1